MNNRPNITICFLGAIIGLLVLAALTIGFIQYLVNTIIWVPPQALVEYVIVFIAALPLPIFLYCICQLCNLLVRLGMAALRKPPLPSTAQDQEPASRGRNRYTTPLRANVQAPLQRKRPY